MLQTNFNLPEELLSVIPKDPYDQLNLAHKLTSMAVASHVSNLEYDISYLQQQLKEKDQAVCKLEEKAAWLERATRETDLLFKSTLDENVRLSIERDSLSSTVKGLTRDVSKLDRLKRQLVQLLTDDNNSSTIKAEETLTDVVGSPANASPPPRRSCSVPPPPGIDGKDFFRQARSRLSREQFRTLLANINARGQNRKETLKKAEEIFGTDNEDLYLLFHTLLNRKSGV